ncbi:MAG: SpoIID/LytB domain-containing protein [Muribaculaceae bacterium]|nr:SpoIID/LytB domain-containing protein [Muribaculaceae bacterium]
MNGHPDVNVGILTADRLEITFHGTYIQPDNTPVRGPQTFSQAPDGRIAWQGELHDEVTLRPADAEATFEIFDVVIGVNFHWERRENQRFSGACRVISTPDGLTVINTLPVEDYLLSVISSEMSAHASLELLKAHAVISRSWLLAQIKHTGSQPVSEMVDTPEELIKWYDREDHTLFDVCADDHCQRYQGVTRQSTPKVAEAIRETAGQVLLDENKELCDARFSKCCGGVFEEFQYCWDNRPLSYLVARRDSPEPMDFKDLRIEANAEAWINSRPDAFCNTSDAKILAQVLNNYDQETTDFYRWTVEYTTEELSKLVRERSGLDYGTIKELIPMDRGTSGRLWRLKIVGSKLTRIIGKELEIRRTLSPSHLYSSAFTVEKTADGFRLHGAGWGHGAGLCQIGAAVMGEKGYDYAQILAHYYPGAELSKIY